MKFLYTILCALFGLFLYGQPTENSVFNMVSDGIYGFSGSNPYTIDNAGFYTDALGKGYLMTQVPDPALGDTFRIITSQGFVYQLTAVSDQTFYTADLTVIPYGPTPSIAPSGTFLIYDPGDNDIIPKQPTGPSGMTDQLQAAIDTWNSLIEYSGSTVSNQDSVRNDSAFIYVNGQEVFSGTARALDTCYLESIIQDGTGVDSAEVWRCEYVDGSFYRDTSKIQDIENHGNILYVATTGSNVTAKKGNPHFPYRTPLDVQPLVTPNSVTRVLDTDSLTYTGPYDGVANRLFQDGKYNISGRNYYRWEGFTTPHPALSDYTLNAGFGAPGATRAVDLFIDAPNTTFSVADISLGAAIHYTNPNSRFIINAKRFDAGATNNMTGIYLGNKYSQVNIDTFNCSSSIFTTLFWFAYDESGVAHNTNVGRHYELNIGQYNYLGGSGSDFGLIRVGTGGAVTDDLANASINIDEFNSLSNVDKALFNIASPVGAFTNSSIKVHIKKARFTASGFTYDTHNTNNSSAARISAIYPKSTTVQEYIIDEYYGKGGLWGSFSQTDNVSESVIIFRIGKGRITNGGGFWLDQMNLTNNSKMIIHCDDCVLDGGTAVYLNTITCDATSSIVISGKWRMNKAGSRLANLSSVSNSALVLENLTINNPQGTSPVTANVPTDVVCKNVFSYSTTVDANVNEMVQPMVRSNNVK